MKTLGEFPKNIWIEAAGECDGCGALPKVMITFTESEMGDATFQIKHAPNCYQIMDGEATNEEQEEIIGWVISKQKLTLTLPSGVKTYEGFSRVANCAPCSSCGLIVFGVPLILFSPNRKAEYHWCMPCANKDGITRLLVPSH